ncbi:MAG: choice-of-anchor B family protein [Longimicrobiales bacterium]
MGRITSGCRTALFLLLLVGVSGPITPALDAQQFGGSLAVWGDQILVGEGSNQTLSGIIYVYGEGAQGWSEIGQISVSEALRAPDGFGRSFAVSDGWLVAGAPLEAEDAGAVYVFRGSEAGTWSRVARVEGSSPGDRLGSAVAFQGQRVLVSAPGAGTIHTLERADGGDWSLLAEGLTASSEFPSMEGFGQSMAVTEERLVAATASRRGEGASVFLFDRDPGTAEWSGGVELGVDALPPRSGYGAALAVRGDVAFVGAPGANERRGAVYVFGKDGAGDWQLANELGPLAGGPGAAFGSSLSWNGDRLVVGAPGGAGGTGQVFEFAGTGPLEWTGATRISSAQVPLRGGFGGHAAFGESFAVVGALGVDANQGAAVILERNPSGGWTDRGTVVNEARGFPSITGSEVHCVEGQAELFECKDVNVTAFLPISELGGKRGTRVNDIWGWTDPESGREYAIVGRSNGTSFVDITDPYYPVYLGDLPMTEGSRDTIWRDMKVYRDHVYVVADNALEHGVQVFDLRRLRGVEGANPEVFEVDFLYDGIHSAHNIVINEETGFAYAVGNSGGGETCGGGLHMINLENPARPVFAGCFADPETGRRRTGYSHDAQCVVYDGPDEDHQGKEVCFGSNETALNIADVTDKAVPVTIATASYPNVAYAHQGWLTEDHSFFYMNDEGDEPQGLVAGTRTLVWDVTDLDDPVLVKEHIAETQATDHNLYVRGNTMYQSNYSAGLRILDVSEPADPVEIGFFDTSPYEGGASWSNYPFFESGIIAVTGTGDGLFLLRNMARRNLVP